MEKSADNQIVSIAPDQSFCFACGPGVDCFNACCRDLNQFLTPYDVLRLKNHLAMTSGDFLAAYAGTHDGPQSGLPVVTLRPQPGPELKCPFVTADGCRVYADRPASCRMYPVARMARRNRHTGQVTAEYMLIREAHCRGFDRGAPMTVGQWMADQGVLPYNESNDAMIALIGIKQQHHPDRLPRGPLDEIFMALYDLDRFRLRLGNGDLPKMPDGLCPEDAQTVTDERLLQTAMAYAGSILRAKAK
ncbi:MAG: YkgJ family cysteine cluster protein [Thermodesulfobacteriota bacterium]